MSAPNETHPRRRRRWAIGAAVAAAVLVVALLVLALLPRSATATASLTVTPRSDAGADAALLLADRYTALAGAAGTLRAAQQDRPALADVSVDELEEGTSVERAEGTATITVQVTLADRAAAVAAANAVVDELVEAGTGEDLVDVDRGAEATPARTSTSPDPARWTPVAVLLALACGLAATALTGRGSRPGRPAAPQPTAAPAADGAPAEVHDDLPRFLEHPPGSLPAAPVAPVSAPVQRPQGPPTGATAAAGNGRSPVVTSRATATVATVATVVAAAVLVGTAVLVAVTAGRDDAGGPASAPSPVSDTGPAAPLTAPTEPAAPGLDATAPTTSAPASATETAAGARAFESVPLGEDGVAASVSFEGIVLEQRAVGLTVTYPSLSLTTDGQRSLAHVRLPTFNCLTTEPPADPVAAGCARSLTEYADLADPQLQVSRTGDRIDVVGLFPTYTRPNGSAPAHTGRAYQLTAAITADGPASDRQAPAAGVVRIGLDSAPTTADRGVNRLQFPG